MRQESYFTLLKKLDSATASNILKVSATSSRNNFPCSFHFVTFNSENSLRLFHSSISSNSIKIDKHQGPEFSAMSITPDSSRVFLGHCDGTVSQYLISAKRNNRVKSKPHFKKVNDISFGDNLMATSSNDKLVKLFSLKKFPKAPKFRHSFKAGSHFALKSVFEQNKNLGILNQSTLTFQDLNKFTSICSIEASALSSISNPQISSPLSSKIQRFLTIRFKSKVQKLLFRRSFGYFDD